MSWEMKIPRPDDESKEFFKSLLPTDQRVTSKSVFGNPAAFVNGNMFMGLWGNDVFLRVSEVDQKDLQDNHGASEFEPMKGKPMKGYILLSRSWRGEPKKFRSWVSRSLVWAGHLPMKGKKS
jgi:TfoX/Sxy family transcriptional regulator of competence genes